MASIDVEMLKAAMQNRREDGFEPEATTEIAERGRAGLSAGQSLAPLRAARPEVKPRVAASAPR